MTLTTEQLRARIAHYRELAYLYGMSGHLKHEAQCRDDAAFLEELLANREAQPVAKLVYSSAMPRFIGDTNEIEGYRCWIHGETRLAPTMEQAYADAKAVCTSPPAPEVPEEMTGGIAMSKYKVKKSNYVQWVKGWNSCRAAMLAQPVSQGYTLPPHVYRELVNSLRDTAEKYQGTQQLREQLSRTLTENGLVAAAPEGGNGA
ncbi:hypothetical protein ACUNI4_25235 [Serratia sp. IR-2025]